MKKLILIMLLSANVAWAQDISVEELKENGGTYIQVDFRRKGKINVITHTNTLNVSDNKAHFLVENNKPVIIKNSLDGLNYLYKLGYELVLNYSAAVGTNFYILKKRIN
jgi:hypothetical protein